MFTKSIKIKYFCPSANLKTKQLSLLNREISLTVYYDWRIKPPPSIRN